MTYSFTVDDLINLLAWVGAFSYLVGYFLLASRKIQVQDTSYMMFNLVGAALLVLNGLYIRDYPTAFLNLAWGGIALIPVFRKS
ncbi:CBU_0592 family membrane protein [Reichenbachiella versicolor]|uniref:CBU_0592 family membrane protein n=1 Tax=Reichenbachiella versicolor TaxID=1821036 RepID=UPI000D6DE733|nr:hypothetical protein [Reichenbachiella versicolor]